MMVNFVGLQKRRCLMKAFTFLNSALAVNLGVSQSKIKQLNRISESVLRLTYSDYHSSFSELFEIDNSVTIHNKNMQVLVVENFEVTNDIAPEIMKNLIMFRKPSYNFRS